MPADLRIAQLVTDPYRPEAAAPLRFMVECANVGDEGTGPFFVRFELDQAESVDVYMQNVAPHESEWVNWDHDGMRAGDHHIYCLLDADHEVPEPESQRNQQSRYFKVAEIEFAPQDAHGDRDYDKEALANAVVLTIEVRVNQWTTLAFQAVNEWENDAQQLVLAYDDANATVDPHPVIAAFGKAIVEHAPGMSTVLGVMEDASELVDVVRSSMGGEHLGLGGARAKLNATIRELRNAANTAILKAIKDFDAALRKHLSPDNDESPLHQVEYGSTDPEYVAALADWLGVPMPDEETTTKPIKEEIMEGFKRVMENVNRQLFREIGAL